MPGKASISDSEFLRQIALAPEPVVTATEMAELLDMTRQNANYRLKSLYKDGLVERKEVGSRAVVWWLTDAGRDVAYRS